MSDPTRLTAGELSSRYADGSLSPVEATQAALAAIERFDGKTNAFVLVDPEGALTRAKESEARWRSGDSLGRADGIPTSIKDIFLTRGWPTLRGSNLIDAASPWPDDAPCVARLREAGAVFLGKTTTPEFAWKGVTDSLRFGATGNPWDPRLTPGGSSGGSATAVALGMGAWSVGTDGGGSVRIPASFTGTVALKPTYGLIPLFPASPFGTLSHAGPMTRTSPTRRQCSISWLASTSGTGRRCRPRPDPSSTDWTTASVGCGSASRRTWATCTTTRRSSGWCARQSLSSRS